MRVDSLSPKTWLLAGFAGWAVCLWLFAMFGLGQRLGKTETGAEAQRLPSTTIPRADRPGPQAQFAAIGERPLFAENRRHQDFRIDGSGEAAQANTFDYTLTSVLIASGVELAILKPAADGAASVRVKVGEAVETAPQWTLASLLPRSAVFRGPDGEKTLDLRVFDGVGGAAPPPVAPPVAQTAVINESAPSPGADQPGPQGPAVVPTPPPATANTDAGNVSTQAQLDAIRKRIEARRAQLRQQAAQEAQNPVPPPGQTP